MRRIMTPLGGRRRPQRTEERSVRIAAISNGHDVTHLGGRRRRHRTEERSERLSRRGRFDSQSETRHRVFCIPSSFRMTPEARRERGGCAAAVASAHTTSLLGEPALDCVLLGGGMDDRPPPLPTEHSSARFRTLLDEAHRESTAAGRRSGTRRHAAFRRAFRSLAVGEDRCVCVRVCVCVRAARASNASSSHLRDRRGRRRVSEVVVRRGRRLRRTTHQIATTPKPQKEAGVVVSVIATPSKQPSSGGG